MVEFTPHSVELVSVTERGPLYEATLDIRPPLTPQQEDELHNLSAVRTLGSVRIDDRTEGTTRVSLGETHNPAQAVVAAVGEISQ